MKSATVTRLPGSRRRPKPSLPPVLEVSQAAVEASRPRRANPGLAFGAPLHPPGVIPQDASLGIAADDAIGEAWGWAQNAMSSTFAEGTTFLGYAALSILAQRAEYRVISEEIASEMTREWIELKSVGDEDKTERIAQLDAEMKRLDVREHFRRGAAVYDGLFGRGHIYVDTGDSDDREELQTPIGDGWNLMSRAKIGLAGKNGRTEDKKIVALRPIEPVWCYPTRYDSNDPLKADWYKPTSWHVMGKEVHVSRLLTFIGREVPDMLKPAYSFGGLSMTQMAKPYVDNWLRTRQSVSDLVANFSVRGLKSPGVAASLQAGGDTLYRRAEVFNNVSTNSGLMLLDMNEEYFNVTTPLSTLEQLQAQAQEHMASVSRIPLVKLLGIQPAGLNASSEGEIRAFYDWIASFQELLFRPNLHALIGLIMLGLWGEVDKNITFEFKSLWQLDAAAKVAVEKTKTDIDDANVAMGSVSPEEVRRRIAQDPDSPYAGLDLDPDALPEPPEPDPSEMMGHNGGPDLNDNVGKPRDPRDPSEGITARAGNLASPTGGFGNDEWNEGDHPRGQPENAGQFGSGGSAAALHPTEGAGKERTTAQGKALPSHIAALKIPPAWTDVRYNPDPKGALLATGRDAKGREQRVYSAEFAASNAAAKFSRIHELDSKFASIKNQNEIARRSPDKRVREAADVTALIMATGIRPGGEGDTGAEKQAFGATTLQGQHITLGQDGKVHLRFIGKKGVDLDIVVDDANISKMLLQRAKRVAPSESIFPAVNAQVLLNYVHTLNGGNFKTKDFRTLHGTRTAIREVARLPTPKNESSYKQSVREVAKIVAEKLGNTPIIALQSYISPVVFAKWRMASGTVA